MRLKKLFLALLIPLLVVGLTAQRFPNRRSFAGTTYVERVQHTRPESLVMLNFDERAGTTAAAWTGLTPNILANPGFEVAGGGGADVFANWTETKTGASTIEATTAAGEFRTGTAAKINRVDNAAWLKSDNITVAPSTTYTLNIWTRGDGTAAGDYGVYDVTNSAYVAGHPKDGGITGTTYQQVSATFTTAANTTTIYINIGVFVGAGTGIAYFDDCQLLGPAGLGTPFNATYSGVTLAQAGGPNGRLVPSFDGTNDFTNLYTTALINAFSGAEGTIILPVKVSAAGVWTDGTLRAGFYLYADANNYVDFYRSSTNNRLTFAYSAAGTTETASTDAYGGNLGWLYAAITWSKSAEAVKYYINGNLLETDTALGIWAGNLASATTVVGSLASSVPSNVWSGWIGPPALYTVALTPAEIGYICSPSTTRNLDDPLLIDQLNPRKWLAKIIPFPKREMKPVEIPRRKAA